MENWKDGIRYSEDGKTLENHNDKIGKRVEISEGTKRIEWFSMQNLELDYLRIPKSVDRICGRYRMDPPLANSEKCAFDGCEIGTVEFAEGTKKINRYALYGATVKKLIIPDTVTTIEDNAFYQCGMKKELGCLSLNGGTLKLHDGIKSIGKDAFAGCGIKEAELPSSLEYIGAKALGGDIRLIRIIGDKPIKGLIESIRWCTTRPAIGIEFRGLIFAFPTCPVFRRPFGLTEKEDAPALEVESFMAQWNKGEFDENFAKHAFMYTDDKQNRAEAALIQLELDPGNTGAMAYLKGPTAEYMLDEYIKYRSYDRLKAILTVPGLLPEGTLQKVLERARQGFKDTNNGRRTRQRYALMALVLDPNDAEAANAIGGDVAESMLRYYAINDDFESLMALLYVPGLFSKEMLQKAIGKEDDIWVHECILRAMYDMYGSSK